MSTVVVDASAIVALLTDDGPDGTWASQHARGYEPAAPHLLPFEAANVLHRQELRGRLSPDQAALAHADLLALDVDLYPHSAFAGRAWQLRANATTYDAAYLALAELLDAPLLTLDRKLTATPGIHCEVQAP